MVSQEQRWDYELWWTEQTDPTPAEVVAALRARLTRASPIR